MYILNVNKYTDICGSCSNIVADKDEWVKHF